MNAQPSSLRALLETTPVSKLSSTRSPVRMVLDDNFQLFKELAERGYPHAEIAKSFMLDFSHVRSARPSDDDEAYLAHIASTFSTFKRHLYRTGVLIKGKKSKPAKASAAPKVKATPALQETPETVSDPIDAAVASTPPEQPVTAPKPTVVLPNDGGFQVPKITDL